MLDFGHFYVLGIQVAQCLVILVSELAEVMIEIRVHLITTSGFQSHNFNSQAFLGNGQSRVMGIGKRMNESAICWSKGDFRFKMTNARATDTGHGKRQAGAGKAL